MANITRTPEATDLVNPEMADTKGATKATDLGDQEMADTTRPPKTTARVDQEMADITRRTEETDLVDPEMADTTRTMKATDLGEQEMADTTGMTEATNLVEQATDPVPTNNRSEVDHGMSGSTVMTSNTTVPVDVTSTSKATNRKMVEAQHNVLEELPSSVKQVRTAQPCRLFQTKCLAVSLRLQRTLRECIRI